ncbi:hypothetical protein Y032_0484g2313 [Ancylostoma ceylanicum]|uniref:Uncharacterized protein n=1 Tax=Ancylostoma ceylanicum TaxID=53326 RepID=A0A016WVI1_9BILA|nr:hypothetical protein Y032_0484g2313 [Ancylostoma ceylanicum]
MGPIYYTYFIQLNERFPTGNPYPVDSRSITIHNLPHLHFALPLVKTSHLRQEMNMDALYWMDKNKPDKNQCEWIHTRCVFPPTVKYIRYGPWILLQLFPRLFFCPSRQYSVPVVRLRRSWSIMQINELPA